MSFSRKATPIGAVTVTTAGTRVRLSSTLSAPTADLPTPWIFIQAAEGNGTGVVFVGLLDVTSTKYVVALSPGEGAEITAGSIRGSQGEYFLNDFYIDASNNGDKVYVTYDKARG